MLYSVKNTIGFDYKWIFTYDDDIDELKARLDEISNKEGSFSVQYLPYNALLMFILKIQKMLFI
ncbi:hypothetical protein [Acetivibrio clariflavus]|uniref:Uncharacterized protein n=1 Tax=Acetivibrio clariflavus (strain DSM 19732 / NBRC 101661 / EBR45) TaxID=720554 RepID=G8LWD7_ACECE|nr:hypothetical protein [Acetivibrio clariflavus]AEV67563.1 hypothetical protein Clocl_0880 [Acetivibrio clariflavus DSM 19732]